MRIAVAFAAELASSPTLTAPVTAMTGAEVQPGWVCPSSTVPAVTCGNRLASVTVAAPPLK